MSRKRLILPMILIVGPLCGIAALALYALTGPGVTRATFARIEEGMTYEEVRAIFNEDPTYHAGRPWSYTATWKSPSGCTAAIGFAGKISENPRVVSKHWAWFDFALMLD